MNGTTTCTHSNPQIFDGSAPTNTDQFFAFASSTCTPELSATSTTDGFTNGELINSVFLFLIFSLLAFWFLTSEVIRYKIKNKE